MRLMIGRNERIDRIANPSRSTEPRWTFLVGCRSARGTYWHRRPRRRMIGPMIARIGRWRLRRGVRTLVDPPLEQLDLFGRKCRALALRRHSGARLARDHRHQEA